ncbi:MAG: hypothetical protein ACYC4J_14650 [Gemmatimonadaceae bacterium]
MPGSMAGKDWILSTSSRIIVALAAALLVAMFFTPIWHIALEAPQYPEGIGMQIRINTIAGDKENDLNNINGLNHYIGMKPIDPDTIPELRYMPWAVAVLVGTGWLVAALGRRKPLYAWTAGFLVVALAGLVDFWWWGYKYGHDLDAEHAIIKIPGMAYSPPVIGSKQILNFTAHSWPSTGGIAAGLAMALALAAAYLTRRRPAGAR